MQPMQTSQLSYNKVCNLEDFADPALRSIMREVLPHEVARFGEDFPSGVEMRRYWEIAMAVRAFRDFGVLHDQAEVLGVGAGNEPTIFYLTTRVKRVFATDIYLAEGRWAHEANSSMLTDPGSNWPGAWNPKRLVVQHMDGRRLEYPDASFDGIFSCGSIEHFGTWDDIGRAGDELFRVLKPGGVLALSTEYLIDGPDHGSVGTMFFGRAHLERYLIGNRAWDLVSPLDLTLTDRTRQTVASQNEAYRRYRRHIKKYGRLLYHRFENDLLPRVVMTDDSLRRRLRRRAPHVWTSVSLVLRKRG
jgi:SAM-dependent methyltransferase